MSKNVFIVRCDRETFESSFTRKKNSDIINHYEIHQKLTNNDSSKTPPSDEIVNYQIVKRLNSFRECRKTEFVFVLREKIDQNFIIRLKEFFGECFVPVFYHLLVDKEVKDKKLIKEFNTVSLLDHDKNSNS
jgi:hypothetical protein